MRAVGYVRVSTGRQEESGAGLEDQRRLIAAECERRGWDLVRTFEDTASARSTNGRKHLAEALDLLDAGQADVLITKSYDRLTRSVIDFGRILERRAKSGWQLIVVDLDVNTTTATGELVAGIFMQVAQWERRVIGERTKAALAVKREQGVRLGRPRRLPDSVRRRIKRRRSKGLTYAAIATELNRDEVATAQGGKVWYPATVRKIALS